MASSAMPNRLVRFALLVLVFMALPLHSSASAQDDDPFAAALDEHMPGLLQRYRVPGVVIVQLRHGQVDWSRAYGVSDLRTLGPMHEDRAFEFGPASQFITAWAVMKLAEQGRLDLDAPINPYLKRYQLASGEFDAGQVTLRQVLSHSAGLNIGHYSDYSPRRRLPTLVEVLAGKNQQDGQPAIVRRPGSAVQASSVGYALAQMVVEDVTGEPFEQFVQREITGPLGATSLRWTWTPDLRVQAATPHSELGSPLEYRQLAPLGAGSAAGSVQDFARLVAAAAPGPNGERPGRGVLRPETVAQMTASQPGLGYRVDAHAGNALLTGAGGNPGWDASFYLDPVTGNGFVSAANSSLAGPLNVAIANLWLRAEAPGYPVPADPEPLRPESHLANQVALALATILATALLATLVVFVMRVARGQRRFTSRPRPRRFAGVLVWAIPALLLWTWLYSPLALPFPPSFPDIWASPQIDFLMAMLLAWITYSVVSAFVSATQPSDSMLSAG